MILKKGYFVIYDNMEMQNTNAVELGYQETKVLEMAALIWGIDSADDLFSPEVLRTSEWIQNTVEQIVSLPQDVSENLRSYNQRAMNLLAA